MNRAEIMGMQRKVGTVPDGFWGPASVAACQRHLRGLMPRPHPFPRQGTRDFLEFYGRHGEPGGYTPPMRKVRLPFALYLYGDRRSPLAEVSAHVNCADALGRVFDRLEGVYGSVQERMEAGVAVFDGIYNPRLIRGSASAWSMHAWAVAIDLDAGRNGYVTQWPMRARMPLEAMECFAAEGFLAGGAFWGRDAMHFQATAP